MDIFNIFNSFIVGIDFRRQNLTSIDVIFWRLKTVPTLKGLRSPHNTARDLSFYINYQNW